jgi:Flp pilus assembly protein TadB
VELVNKLRKRFNARESKVAAEQAAREAAELADETAARQIAPRRGLFEGEPPADVLPEVRVTATGTESDQAVPAALKVAAAWAWRVFLVAGLVYFVGWILGFLSEVVIPLAVAILLDATLVRAVLLPAAMKLLGERNWYLPKRLSWLPKWDHEPTPEPVHA